jgi:hypothetical protein
VVDFSLSVRNTLASSLRLLSSSSDGEVLAAVRATMRVLKTAGADIHALADRVEQADTKLSEAEM